MENTGKIISSRDGVWATYKNDAIANSGTIAGEINLHAGPDCFGNSGSVIGNVDLGFGDDTYSARGWGRVNGVY